MEMTKISNNEIEIKKEIISKPILYTKRYNLDKLNDEISCIQSKLIELQLIKAELLKE